MQATQSRSVKNLRVFAAIALSAVLALGVAAPAAAAPAPPEEAAAPVVVEGAVVEEVATTTTAPPVEEVAVEPPAPPPETIEVVQEAPAIVMEKAEPDAVEEPATTTTDVLPPVGDAPERVPPASDPGPSDITPDEAADVGAAAGAKAAELVVESIVATQVVEWVPPTYPAFNPEVCVEYRLQKHISTWSAETGQWSDWSPLFAPLEWGDYPSPRTDHLGGVHGENGDLHRAYIAVEERPIESEECRPEVPEYPPIVEMVTDDCFIGNTMKTDTTTTTTFTAVWNGTEWVKTLDELTVTTTERPFTEEELAECTPSYQPEERVERGDCETGDATVFEATITTTFKAVYTEVDEGVFDWVKMIDSESAVGSDRPLTDEEQAECEPPELVTETESVDGTFECEDTTVVQTRTVTTTPYMYVVSEEPGAEWVLDTENAVTVTEERVRDLEPDEITVCPFIDFAVLGPVCIGNIPFINWTVIGDGFDQALPLTITISQDGNVIQTIENAPYDGQVVWPGASVDPEDWPGWRLNADGIWLEDPSDAVLREPLTVTGSVNPDASGTVEYPPSSAECVEPPQTPPTDTPPTTVPPTTVPPTTVVTPQLPATGSELSGILILASMVLLVGGVTLLAGRPRTAD